MWLKKTTIFMTLIVALNAFHSQVSEAETSSTNTVKRENEINSQKDNVQLSLNQIMADPDWMGNSPTEPHWSVDGLSVFYAQKANGHQHKNHFKVRLSDQLSSQVPEKDSLFLASQQAEKNQTATQGVFTFQGDVYWTEFSTGEIKPLTADDERQSNIRFAKDNRLSYFEGHSIFLYDLNKGYARQIASFKTENDPQEKEPKDYLEQSQPRLFQFIKQREAEKSFQETRKDKARVNQNKTWYLGEDVEIRTFRLSPDANWLILGTVEKSLSGDADNMPEYVTADGYANNRKVRPLVGSSQPLNETFYLVDLVNHKKITLDTSNLPGINDDPLDSLKKKAAKKIGVTICRYIFRHIISISRK